MGAMIIDWPCATGHVVVSVGQLGVHWLALFCFAVRAGAQEVCA